MSKSVAAASSLVNGHHHRAPVGQNLHPAMVEADEDDDYEGVAGGGVGCKRISVFCLIAKKLILAKRKSTTVQEIERLQKNREERRARHEELRQQKQELMNIDPGNPNWEFLGMIRYGDFLFLFSIFF